MPRTKLSAKEDARCDLVKYIKGGFLQKGKKVSDSKRVIGMSYETLNERMKAPHKMQLGEMFTLCKALGLEDEMILQYVRKTI